MPKRITVTYTCTHGGDKLPTVQDKYWDTCPDSGRVCWCVRDPEKNKPMATPMKQEVSVTDSIPE